MRSFGIEVVLTFPRNKSIELQHECQHNPTKDKKLGRQAHQVFKAAEQGETQLILSVISMAEMYFANVKHGWFSDFAQIYHDLMSSPYFQFEAFNIEDVLRFTADAAIPEMHDRIIAGLARHLGVPLIASDPLIVQANIVKTVW